MTALATRLGGPGVMDLRHGRRLRRSRLRAIGEIAPKRLFEELHRIHRHGPVEGMRLRPDGQTIDYQGTNAGGYTLEALLGISPNGRPDPDFEGWEIKAHGVQDFERPGNALLTLLTSEPTGGFYADEGPEAFVRRFGYAARGRWPGKLNIYANHRVGRRSAKTGLTLHLLEGKRDPYGYCDPPGALVLSDDDGFPAAVWPLAKLADHWNRKHALAAYVPYVCGRGYYRSYHYGPHIRIGQGTSFDLFQSMLAAGRIFYDPGLTLADPDNPRCRVRRRSLFRIRVGDLPGLYERFDPIDVRRAPIAIDTSVQTAGELTVNRLRSSV